MFDCSDLRLSQFYPIVLQVLRKAADWIQESMEDLHRMVDDMERLYFSPNTGRLATFLPPEPEAQDAAIAVFKQNWESVRSHQQRLGKALLARIIRKQEEVESLKDGVSPSAGVNHFPSYQPQSRVYGPPDVQRDFCQRGDKVNAAEPLHLSFHRRHRVLSTTELYCSEYFTNVHSLLQLSLYMFSRDLLIFRKAFFALGLFDDWSNPKQERLFLITIAVVAGGTYLFSGLLIWFTQQPDRLQALRKACSNASIVGWVRRRMSKGWRND